MQNVLLTGGCGFIGSNFVHFLLNTEPAVRVIVLDALTYAGNLDNLADIAENNRLTFIQGDICDRSLLDGIFAVQRPDTVVHFAAESHVDRSILGPMQFVQTNISGTATLLEAARNAWQQNRDGWQDAYRFHHVSTDEVFGSLKPDDPPFSESTPYAPNSPYAASKAASDHLVRAYHHTYGMPVTITNCSNNYGAFQFPEKLVPLVILNARHSQPLPVYGDGRQVRDWLFVDDHCQAILEVLRSGRSGETYNVGGGNQPTNLEIVESICDILDAMNPDPSTGSRRSLIQFVEDRPGHDRRYAMDISKIRTELGWQPAHSLQAGLQKTVQWYLDNPAWMDGILHRPEFRGWLSKNYENRGGKQP